MKAAKEAAPPGTKVVAVTVLTSLDEEDRRRVLSTARRRRFANGEVIVREGDPGDTFHLIAKGRVAAMHVEEAKRIVG